MEIYTFDNYIKRRFTPRLKKQMRYLKDRRNAYGENNKASRKTIRLRKKTVNKAYRRNTKQTLLHLNDLFNEEITFNLDIKIKNIKRKYWKKWPDISLKEHIEIQNKLRLKRANRKKQ